MIDKDTYTLVDQASGELAFKLYRFESLRHFDHVQRLNYYSLIWIQEGRGKAQIETEQYNYEPNMLFATSTYQPFMFQPSEKTKGVVIHFHPNFFCILKHHAEIACDGVLFNNIYEHPFLSINKEEEGTLNWIVKEMEDDIKRNSLATNEAIISYLKLFLINCSRSKKRNYPTVNTTPIEDDNFKVQGLKNYIEDHYKELHSPKDYAELLHISPNALTKLVKATFNKTPSQLISERIIIEAKRELYLSPKTVEEISLELGYEDQFYFSRFFKKHTGVSPSIYRKTVGENIIAKERAASKA